MPLLTFVRADDRIIIFSAFFVRAQRCTKQTNSWTHKENFMGKHICKFCIHCDSMSSDTPLYDYYVCPYCEGVFRPFRQVECSHYVDIHTGETDSGSTTSSSYSSSSSSSYTSSTPRKKTLAELHPKESKQFQIKAKFAIVLGFLPVVFAIALAFVLFLKPIG